MGASRAARWLEMNGSARGIATFRLLLVAAFLLCARAVWAQGIGTVASLEGSADIGRAGGWTPASIGAVLEVGDAIRTGQPGRVRIVFQDESVLTITDATELVVDEHVFEPAQGVFRSVIRLLRGKLKALASDYYGTPRASYQIETPTASTGVRGTEFVIAFDAVTEVTDVVGVSGRVAVHSVLDRVAHGVVVTAREVTTVARGQFPTPPRPLDETLFRQYLEGLVFIGAGRSESLLVNQPLLLGAVVPQEERAATAPVGAAALAPGAPAPAGPLAGGAPVAPPQMPDQVQPVTTPSDIIKESVSVITHQGQLGIDF
jgi:hypothetical protein